MSSRLELKDVRTPVTPMDDTMYTKPSASEAIIAILSSDVGAIIEMSLIPYFVQ